MFEVCPYKVIIHEITNCASCSYKLDCLSGKLEQELEEYLENQYELKRAEADAWHEAQARAEAEYEAQQVKDEEYYYNQGNYPH